MAIRERASAAYQAFKDPSLVMDPDEQTIFSPRVPDDPVERYELLEAYKKNQIYDSVRRQLLKVAVPADFERVRALENPSLQAVQFGVMHLFPGTLKEAMKVLPGGAGSEALTLASERVLQWSNMAAQKDAIADDVYTLGDTFLKAVVTEDQRRSFVDERHPKEFTAFREDNLRNMRYVRLDVELDPNEDQPYDDRATWYTELWDKEQNLYVAWRHKRGREAKLDQLGTPLDGPKAITNFGHDFVPFVRIPFEAGARPNRLSPGVFQYHLEPVDQLNRIATELDELFRENAEGMWAVLRNESGKDAVQNFVDSDPEQQPEEHRAHGRKFVSWPGMTTVQDLVPKINYEHGLKKIEDRRLALERSLAELRYFRGIEGGDPSAAAMRQAIAPAIARARAAKGNAEDGVIRAVKMCLTMGAKRRQFAGAIGTFEGGQFDTLGFEQREIMPETPSEKAGRQEVRARVWKAYSDMGLLQWYLENEEGMSEDEAKEIAGMATTTSRRARVGELVNDV